MHKLSKWSKAIQNSHKRLLKCVCSYIVPLITLFFPFQVYAAFPDPLVNTATVTVPAGVTDPTSSGGVNTATDSNSLLLPSLAIVKTLDSNADEDTSGSVTLNDTLTYSVTVTNDGSTTLTNVAVSDALLTPNANNCASVAPSATCVLTGTYVVQQSDVDAGSISNTGSVTSTEVPGPTTDVLNTPVAQNNSLAIVKTLDSNADEDTSGSVTLNDTLTYSVTVTNDGSTTLTNVAVSDALLTPNANNCASVAPSATCVLTGTYVVQQSDVDAGSISNTGSVTSTEVPGPTTDVLNTPVAQNNSLAIVKTLDSNADEDTSGSVTLNDTLTYSVTVTNDGSTTLTNVAVSDALLTPNANNCASVAPSATCVLTGTYVVQQSDVDAGSISNTGSVTSTEVPGPTTDVLNTPVAQNNSLAIVKTLDSNADEDTSGSVTLNDTLTYSVTVTNDGSTTLTNVAVSDALLTPNANNCASVAPSATCVLTGTYVVQQSDVDAGSISNTGSVTSTEVPGPTTDVLNTPVAQNNSLAIVKTLDSNADEDTSGSVTLNDTLTYSVTVTNDGSTTLTNVAVSDALLTPNANNCASVAPSATCVLTGTYVVQQSDVDAGSISNTGSVTSTEVPGPTTDVLNTPVAQNNSLAIVKTLDSNADEDTSGSVTLNDTLTYSVTVTNDGSTTLTNVAVSDALLTPNANNCASVAPSATCVLTGTYVVQQSDVDAGSISNTGSVTSTEVPGPTTDVLNTPVAQNNSLAIVKTLDSNADEDTSGSVTLNDTLTYSVTVTNDGSTTLTNVAVSDALLTPNANNCASVAPSATCVLTGTYVVQQSDVDAGSISNTGSVTSTEVPGPTTDVLNTPVAQNNSLAIVKTLDSNADEDTSGSVTLNDTLTYSVTVTNDGSTTLTNVAVSDALLTPNANNCASVAPSATCVLTGTYVVQQSDVDAGSISNTGSVTSTEVPGPTTDVLNTPVAQNNSLAIVKTLDSNADEDTSGSVTLNDTLTYSVTVTNDGSTTLTNVAVSDALLTPNANNCASVAPSATCVLTGTYVVQQSDVDAGSISNTGSVTSTEVPGPTTDVLNTPVAQNNSLAIVKTLDSNADEDTSGSVTLNDTLTYSVTVTNDGSTTLTNVAVSDALLTPNANNCASVAPSATCVLTGTYVVQQSDVDAGSISNTGSVTSTEVPGPTTDVLNTPVAQNNSLAIVKTLDSNADEDTSGSVTLNDTLTYSVTVTNDGSTTLTNVAVSDALLTPNANNCASVAPSATCVLTGTYVVQQSDVDAGSISNTGSVTSTEVPGPTTDVLNTPVAQNNSLAIVKTLDSNADEDTSGSVTLNDTLTYSVTVTNDGSTTLTNVAVSDALLTPNANNCASVAPSATCVLTGTYVVQQSDVDAGSISNTGSVTSTEVPGPTTDVLNTPVAQNNSLAIVKTLDSNADEDTSGSVTLNDTLTYSVTVTNDGSTTLTNVAVSDALLTPNANNCASVAPSATCVLTGTYVVQQSDVDAGSISNTGSVTSTEVPGPTTDVLNTPVAQNNSLAIVKTLDSNADEDTSGSVTLNDTLTYSVTVTNDGSTTLTNVAVSDALLTPNANNCASVAPSATCVLTGTYVVQQSDVDAGSISNTGSVTSTEVPGPTTDVLNTPVAQNNSLAIVKTLDSNADEDTSGSVTLNDTLTYSVTVTNDGSTTLTNVAVSDALLQLLAFGVNNASLTATLVKVVLPSLVTVTL